MADRRAVLEAIRDQYEDLFWRFAREMSKTLGGLALTPHFDANDDRAVGSAVHSTLPLAAAAAGMAAAGFEVALHNVGPAYKITGSVLVEGVARDINLEVHLAGPKGGTSKSGHQFSADDSEELPLFEDEELPETMLFFMGYHLTGARTAVERLFIVWADNRGTEKIELRQNESGAAGAGDDKQEAPQPDMKPVLVRKDKNKDAKDVGGQDKRGDAASGS